MKKSILFIVFVFMLIFIEVVYINVVNGEFYTAEYLEKTNTYVYGQSAKRGRILDVNGNVLVDNEEIYVINYVSSSNSLETAYKLAEILNLDLADEYDCAYFLYLTTDTSDLLSEEEEVLYSERKLSDEEVFNLKISRIDISNLTDLEKEVASIYLIMVSGYSYDKKTIANDITYEEFASISEENLLGVLCEISYVRTYPYGEVLKSIFGSIGPIYEENKEYYLTNGYELTDTVGVSYLEYEYESILKGEKAIYKVSDDGSLVLIKEEVAGNDLYLSIDIEVQLELESVMENEMITAKSYPNTDYFTDAFVAISNPLTGEIIALSGKRLIDNSKNYSFSDITNETLTSSFTIGSVVKAASMSVGYNNDLIDESLYITDSCVKLYYVPEKCSWKSLGSINDITALKYSSNYYQYLLAIGLTGNTYSYNMEINATEEHFSIYRDTFAEFGLGVLTNIDLPGETTGVNGSVIADDLLLNLAIGQYDTYTLFGILQYINTLANNKERLELSIGSFAYNTKEELVFQNTNEILNTLSVSDYYYSRILEGLSAVTTSGTGYGYINSIYNPVGKTGTSESFLDIDNDGFVDVETYTKSFVGYAPFDSPEYSIAVITPHISYSEDDEDDYIYNLSRYISLNITNFLFENT